MLDVSLEIQNSYTYLTNLDQAEVEILISKELSYFAGHFIDSPVLPAIGILDISLFFVKKLFKKEYCHLKSIETIKLKGIIRPDDLVKIEIRNNGNVVTLVWIKMLTGKVSVEMQLNFYPAE